MNKPPCHEEEWGSGGIAPPFFASELDGDECSASRLGALPCGNSRRYLLNRRMGGLQRQSECCGAQKKYLAPTENRNRAIQPVGIRYTDWAIPRTLMK
jgi:hypothetical protein